MDPLTEPKPTKKALKAEIRQLEEDNTSLFDTLADVRKENRTLTRILVVVGRAALVASGAYLMNFILADPKVRFED